MTLTDALIEAIVDELERRRLWIDSTNGLRSMMLVVKLTNTGAVRSVIASQETETVLK